MARAYMQEITVRVDAPEDVQPIIECAYCYRGECRAPAHEWLREAANVTTEEIRAQPAELLR